MKHKWPGMNRLRLMVPVMIGVVAAIPPPVWGRNPDGTLKLIRVPTSTHPVIVTAGDRFTMEVQNPIDVTAVTVELIAGDAVIPIYTSDPHDVFKARDRSTFDLPTWECLVDGWKMSWMWRPRVTVRDLVSVPVTVPAGVPDGFYNLRMSCSAGKDTSERAVRVLRKLPTDYRVVHVTDWHVTRSDRDRRPAILRAVAERVNRLRPAFVLCTGDNTEHNFPDEHELFLDILNDYEVPTFVVGGNHDTGGKVYEGHADELLYIGDPYYSFDFGEDHYTGIDNATRFFDSEQVEWIKRDLQASSNRAMRAIFGHCLYLQSKKDEAWFNNVLFSEFQVGLYLFGHIHRDHQETRDGGATTWIATAPAFDGRFTLLRIAGHRLASMERMKCEPPSTRPQPGPKAATAPSAPPAAHAGGWVPLFDGRTLTGWKVLDEGAFAGHAEVRVEGGTIVLERGILQTGVGWRGDFPREDYEVCLDAMRVAGHDFFCGMTFPVGESPCTLIIGGWGGATVGLSNVDDQHAAENQTTTSMTFENGRWYHVRLRVTGAGIEAWIDDEKVIELARADHRFTVWWQQEPARPFGVATWDTGAALRNIKMRRLPGHPSPKKSSGDANPQR